MGLRGREKVVLYPNTLSRVVHVMRTGLCRAAGTERHSAGYLRRTWDKWKRKQGEVNEWNRFEKTGGNAAVTYHLKSPCRGEFGNHCITFLQGEGGKSRALGLHGATVAGLHVLRCFLRIAASHFSWKYIAFSRHEGRQGLWLAC